MNKETEALIIDDYLRGISMNRIYNSSSTCIKEVNQIISKNNLPKRVSKPSLDLIKEIESKRGVLSADGICRKYHVSQYFVVQLFKEMDIRKKDENIEVLKMDNLYRTQKLNKYNRMSYSDNKIDSVFKLYNEGYSYDEISSKTGVTKSYCMQLIRNNRTL